MLNEYPHYSFTRVETAITDAYYYMVDGTHLRFKIIHNNGMFNFTGIAQYRNIDGEYFTICGLYEGEVFIASITLTLKDCGGRTMFTTGCIYEC